jgi:hypothetical protein
MTMLMTVIVVSGTRYNAVLVAVSHQKGLS